MKLRGTRKLQVVGTIGGSSSFIVNSRSNGATTVNQPGTAAASSNTINGNLSGRSVGSATITGPEGTSASGSTRAGGAGTSVNSIATPVNATAGTSTVAGSTAINTQGAFAASLSPALTGGLGSGVGTVAVSNTGVGRGSTINSANNANIFGSGQAVATTPLVAAGGTGAGTAVVASGATGNTAVDPAAVSTATGTATGLFNSAGAGALTLGGAIQTQPQVLTAASFLTAAQPAPAAPAAANSLFAGTSTNAPPGFTVGGPQGFGVTTGRAGSFFP
jgi:hypothetical protein